MPPLNWNQLQALDLEKLEEDEADDWLQELQTVKIEKEADVDRLQSLFRLCRAVLNIKALQAETAIEEGEKMMRTRTETGNEEAKFLQEIDELKEQISTLRRQAGGKDANSLLREEIRDLEEEKHRLTRELLDSKQELRHEQERSEKYSQRMEQFEKEMRDLRKERDQLLEDVRDTQRQVQRHRESLSERRAEGEDYQKRMRNRNEDMLKLVNEVNNLAESNEMLRKQVDDLKVNLEECTRQMEKTTDQYSRMKEALTEADSALESLQNENQDLQRQLADVGVRGPTEPSIKDELMEAVDKKIEEWKKIFHDKEKESESLKKQVEELQQELIQYRMDSDKHSVVALTKAVEERDQQIQILKTDLAKATEEIESSADLLDELRNQLNAGGSISETQKRRMNLLQKTMKEKENRLTEVVKKSQEAESAAAEKDKQVSDLISRMRQYETGEYGLGEAVDECRELKVQVDIRNKQTIDLTQHCNKLELKVNELLDENDEMRRRLGLDRHAPLDIKFKYAREVERETDRAMNILLQKEIERLEEERIDLKLQMRKLSHKIGERAVALGLSSDELIVVEQFMEELKDKKGSRRSRSEPRSAGAALDDPQSPIGTSSISHRPQQGSQKFFEDVARDNRSLKTKLAHLEAENAKLLQGLKEIRMQLKEAGGEGKDGVPGIQMPTLDKLISYMETRELTGNVDAVLQMKSQLDYMTGRNDELRAELRHLTLDMQKTNIELHSTKNNASRTENELKLWKDVHATGPNLQPIPFAENMPPTSSLIIANLNEHLVQILHESDLKDQQLRNMEDSVDAYQRKLSVLKHQQGLLYRDFMDAKDVWTKEKQSGEKKLQDLELMKIDGESTKIELQRLTDTLAQSDDELKRRLGEMTRKYTVMRINEKMLLRKYAIMTETEGQARKDKEKAEKNALEAETAVIQKLGHLERQREMVSYQLSGLYKALEDSVPKADYEILSRQHVELTEKHRANLEQESELVKKIKSQENVEIELNQLQRESDYLKSQLLAEKERSIKMELLEEASRISSVNWTPQPSAGGGQGSDTDSGISVSELHSVSQRLAVLEMKELNERQRASHAQMMYEEQRDLLRRVEERNSELERKFGEVAKMNLDLQKIERELRDELAGCVTRAVNDADKQRIAQLEKTEATLRGELDKMKELDEVSRSQFRYLENLRTVQNVELEELRKTVVDIQAESDTKSTIGKLHREIVRMKLNETTDNVELRVAKERITTLEVQLLRLRTKLDTKDRELRHFRIEYVFRIQQMRRTITTLRQRFAGSVPFESQEKFHKNIIQLQSERERLQKELVEAVEKQHEGNDRIEELKLRQASLEELVVTLKDGAGTKRIVEWHHKLEEIRLSELKVKRQLARAQEQIQTQSTLINNLESSSANLEEENVKVTKAWEEREISWENREAELESKLRRYEIQEKEQEEDLLEVSAGIFGLPDMTLPIAEQLEKALIALRKYITVDKVTRAQIEKMKKEIETLHSEKRKAEAELLRKQRILLDLRKFVPPAAAATVDSAIAGGWPAFIADIQSSNVVVDQQILQRAAQDLLQTTVASLKARIDQKDEAMEKYRQLLQSAQTELHEARKEQFEESARLREQLREAVDRGAAGAFPKPLEETEEEKSELDRQFFKIVELEDRVMSQEHTIASLLAKLNGMEPLDKPTGVSGVSEMASKLAKLETENLRLQAALAQRREGSPIDGTGPRDQPAVDSGPDGSIDLDDGDQGGPADGSPQDHLPPPTGGPSRHPPVQTRNTAAQTVEESRPPSVATQKNPSRQENPTISQDTYLKMKVRLDHSTARLKERDTENKALKHALAELQTGMTAQATARLKPESENGMRELEFKDLKLKIEELETRVLKQARDARREKHKADEFQTETESLKGEITRKDVVISKLKTDKEKLEKEVDNLESRLAHLRESMKMKLQETENRELKKKLAVLEGQVRTMQGLPAEKPLEGPVEMRSDGVLKWEESKRWQMRVERLKTKLQEKTREVEENEKLIARLKERMSRLEQEKLYNESRAPTAAEKTSSTVVTVVKRLEAADSFESGADGWPREKKTLLETIQEQNLQLERSSALAAEVSSLRSQNSELRQRCTELEIQLTENRGGRSSTTSLVQKSSHRRVVTEVSTADSLNGSNGEADKVVQMLRRLLDQATNERDHWKRDRDAVQKRLDEEREENQTLLGRIRDIQRELQSANEEIEELREDLDEQPRGANIETINRLHDAIDKLEREKTDLTRQLEELKLSSSRLTEPEMQQIVKENKDLKAKLTKSAPRVAWAEHLTADRATGKLVRENGKLRAEMKKLQSEVDNVRVEIEAIRGENGKLDEEVQRLRGISTQSRRWQPVVIGGSGGSNAVTRLIEDKDNALHTRALRVTELDELLKQEIEKNQRQIFEIRRLKEKLHALEYVPPREAGTTSADYLRQIRTLKSELAVCQSEVSELKMESEALNRQIKPAFDANAELDLDIWKERMKIYDRVLHENIELKLECNNLKAKLRVVDFDGFASRFE